MSLLLVCLFCLALSTSFAEIEQQETEKTEHYKGEDHNAKYDHETFLGKEESAKYDELTPEESKKRLAKLIPTIDKDGDGQLSEKELKEHIILMQNTNVEKDMDRAWQGYAAKLDNDKLKWEDYKEIIYEPASRNKELSKIHADMLDRDQKRWTAADRNGDNQLDREEYRCYIHPEHCAHMAEVVVEETLKAVDTNGDGSVDLEEYIGQWYSPEDYPELEGKEPGWVENEREIFKQHRDKDNDGKLNFEEMRQWIMPEGYDHGEAETKHLISMADDNKDGILSKDEVLTHYEVFVGSQLTQYGEQLETHDPTEL